MFFKFETLIFPYNVGEFFQSYYEDKYLYVSRKDESYYDALLNTDDIDLFFQNHTLHSSYLRVVNNGNELSPDKWTHSNLSIANNDRLFVLFNQGYTLIINSGNQSILKLVNFCSDLERELKFRLQFNIYITPSNAQGFAPHYDDHDVFILQVSGTKVWRLYHSPIELPSNKQPHEKGKYTLEEPEFEEELKPGDLLYIPRGLIHEASTTDTASIHITLGLHPNYWFELLQEVANIAQDQPEFRKAIPNGLTDKYYKSQFKEEFWKLTQAFINNLKVDELLERKLNRYIANKHSEDKNRFKDSIQLNTLNLNSVLSKRENIVFKIEKNTENILVNFYGKKLELPLFLTPSLTTLLQPKSFAVKDIGGLITDEGKIDLATKFVQEGFLKIEKINGEN